MRLDFRIVQFSGDGTQFDFYLYSGAFSGNSFIEITGGSFGLVPNHYFDWSLGYGVTIPDLSNYITATKSMIYSSSSPPTLTNFVGGSTLFTYQWSI